MSLESDARKARRVFRVADALRGDGDSTRALAGPSAQRGSSVSSLTDLLPVSCLSESLSIYRAFPWLAFHFVTVLDFGLSSDDLSVGSLSTRGRRLSFCNFSQCWSQASMPTDFM